MKRTFTSVELEEMDMPYEPPPGGCIVSDRIVAHSRWSVRHELIFRLADQPEGEAWLVHYDDPATECQEGQEMWNDQVTATLVRAVEKTVTVWEPVEKSDG